MIFNGKIYDENLNLLNYLPPIMKNILEFNAICESENPEFIKIFEEAEKVFLNCFIKTANIEQLEHLERLLNLNVDVNLGPEQRREQVLLSWGTQLPYTFKNIHIILDTLIGKDSYKIKVDYNKYIFNIHTNFINKDRSIFLTNTLRKIVPANMIIINKNEVNIELNAHLNIGALSTQFITYRIGE